MNFEFVENHIKTKNCTKWQVYIFFSYLCYVIYIYWIILFTKPIFHIIIKYLDYDGF